MELFATLPSSQTTQLTKSISELDLKMIKVKLLDEDEGLGWSEEQSVMASK